MKKLSFLMIIILLCSSSIFAAAPKLEFETSNNEVIVQNFNENDKTICRDNVRFFNKTDSLLLFTVYGKEDNESSKELLCNALVKPNDSQLESCKKDIGNYKYVYIQCLNGEASFSEITCEHSDMYIYVSSFKEGVSLSTDKELTGFWGINWNLSRGETKKIVSNKGNYVLSEESSDGLVYKGKFGGKDATILLYFFENQFFRGAVSYPYEENDAISQYQSVKEQISKKYGSPTKVVESFQRPYYKGDGYEEQALRLNKGTYISLWTFSDDNTIFVSIPKTLDILLIYENTKLAEEYQSVKNEKNLEDF